MLLSVENVGKDRVDLDTPPLLAVVTGSAAPTWKKSRVTHLMVHLVAFAKAFCTATTNQVQKYIICKAGDL